jgi:nuclear transport factor 2 (NTF2) superfamily protein
MVFMTEQRPPLPPFDLEAALTKVQAAEDAWNTCDPHKVSLAYTVDSVWRNRDAFLHGREAIVEFLTAKWERELDYVLRKSLWAFEGNRIAVRFQYESHDQAGRWFRSYGNELWEFDEHGLMRRREASINDVPISESDRRWHGPRPEDERGVEYWQAHDLPPCAERGAADARQKEASSRSIRERSVASAMASSAVSLGRLWWAKNCAAATLPS